MSHRFGIAALLFAIIVMAGGCTRSGYEVQNSIEEFQGIWDSVEPTKREHTVTILISNEKVHIMDRGGGVVGISKTGGMHKAAPDGKQRGETDTFGVDWGTNPKQIEFFYADEGPNLGVGRYGIFEFEGDLLKICLAHQGEPRPTEFVASPTTVLWHLKRRPPPKPKED